MKALASIFALLVACTSAEQNVGPGQASAGTTAMGGAALASAGTVGSLGGGGHPTNANDGGSLPGASSGMPAASAGSGGATAGSGGVAQPPVDCAWPKVDDYAALGAFETARDKNTGPDGTFDVFRPKTLGECARLHPIVSWANGTLFALDQYQALLTHWASHGFVVIASQSNTTAGGVTHKAGIDWLVEQNSKAGSSYFGVLDVAHIGAAGHSQGGGATIAAGAGEPAPSGIVTTLPLMPIANFEADLSILGRQLVPMFNIVATMDNRDPGFAARLFQQMNAELVQAAFIGVHEDAMNAAMAAPTLAWFRFRLMADASAGAYFYPPGTCSLCLDPAWKSVAYKP